MSSMVGNNSSKEAVDARLRLAASRHQVRSFMRRQEKVGSQAVVSWGKFGRGYVQIGQCGHGQVFYVISTYKE